MLNTNGIRIATEPDFAARLAEYMPRFEVYLQFDALSRAALQTIRGADLRRTHAMALANLEKVGLSTTLVATVRKGVNDGEIGDVLRHAAQWRCVRGVNFQPVQDTGRNDGFVLEQNRIVLSEIRRAILDQWGVFGEDDMIPLPCNPEAISIGYGLRDDTAIRPVTHLFPQEELVREAPNSVTFESYPGMRAKLIELLSLSCAGQRSAGVLHEILCCLPLVELPASLGYDKVFRGDDRLLPRPLQLLPGRGQALVHPLRHAGRPDHPVRHLQPAASATARARVITDALAPRLPGCRFCHLRRLCSGDLQSRSGQ